MNDTRLDALIKMLCDERGEQVPELSEEEKPDFFRALCNVRPPLPLPEGFLPLQDEYLSSRTRARGVAKVSDLRFREGAALWQGDITRLDADAIVNACNPALLGCFQPLHNCIDNIIHSNAGVQVRLDCQALMRGGEEPNGRVRVTGAYNLPSRFIFHTVGPRVLGGVTERDRRDLESCYRSCLDRAGEMGLASLAFCCLSTGVYGYPKDQACRLAVAAVRAWLSRSKSGLRVIFNVFTDEDRALYERELGQPAQRT